MSDIEFHAKVDEMIAMALMPDRCEGCNALIPEEHFCRNICIECVNKMLAEATY